MCLSIPSRYRNAVFQLLQGCLLNIAGILLLLVIVQTSGFAQTSPPAAPTVSAAVTAGTPKITVTWNAVPTASYYTLYRSTTGPGGSFSGSLVANTTFVDNNVLNGQAFAYYVTAHNGAGVSSNSNVASATPTLDAPSVSTTAMSGKITVSWSAVTGATYYIAYVSQDISYGYTALGSTTGTSINGGNNVGNGYWYYYKVEAYNNGGPSPLSAAALGRLDLNAPGGGSAVRVPTDKARVSWGHVADATRYSLYRSENPSSYANFMLRADTDANVIIDTNVWAGQIFYYYVEGRNNAGPGRKSMIFGTDGSVMPCPPHNCSSAADAPNTGASGPSRPDPVNLGTGAESFAHAPDLIVYNPAGPAVSWQRQYLSYQGLRGYASPGLSPGWVHTYDVVLRAPAASVWGALNLNYYNGAVETLTPVLDGSGYPTGAFTLGIGAPYLVSGVASANAGEWQSVTITWKDQTQWRFTPHTAGTYALTQITNRMGSSISLSWGLSRELTQVSDPSSSTTLLTLSYGSNGRLASVTDVYNRQVVYGYSVPFSSAPGMLQAVSQVAAAGTPNPPAQWTYDYTVNGQLLNTVTVPSPTGSGTSTVTINYDLLGRVTSLVDANGNRRVYTYSTNTTLVQVKNAANTVVQSWTQKLDAQRNTGITDANNKSTLLEYADVQNPGKPTRVVDKNNKATTYTYDQYGNVLTVTNPRNITTTYTWSYTAFPLGRLTSVQESSKPATVFSYYEPSGLLQSVTSPSPTGSGTVTATFTYDALGNVLTATGAGNNTASQITTTYNYTTDSAYTQPARVGQPITATDNLGHVTHLRYDAQGRVTSLTDSLGNEMNTSYNLIGQPEEIQLPATGQTGTGRGRSVNTFLYVGGPLVTTTVYDESNVQARQITRAYGAEGELLSVAGGTEPVSYTYDALYRPKTLKDGNNNTTTYNYNSVGNISSVQMPGGQTIQFPSYDSAGNLLQRIDGNNVTTNYLYNDAENLLTDIQYPATPSLNVHFGYDSYGRRTSMTDSAGSHTYAYGDADELQNTTTNYTGLPSQIISYAYYPNGSRQSMTTPAGTFYYNYDGAGRQTGILNPFGESSAWTYFNNNWLKTQTLGNGAQTTYTYNTLGQMIDLVNKTGGGTTLSQFSQMAHDGTGNRTLLTASVPTILSLSGVTNYIYDTKNQLTQEQTTRNGGYTDTFGYDSAGNPTSFRGTTKTYNSNNQQIATLMTYDGNGNPTAYNGVTLTFDPENRLTAHGAVLTAGYRGDGLRAWKQTANGRTYFLYDGDSLILELNATGAVLATNTFGAQGLLSRREGANSTFYTFDPQGSVVQRLSAAGAVQSSHQFTAYGVEVTAPASSDPFGSKAQWGYYTDRETGLQLLTHRYYDPQAGRFLTRDPIGYDGGINLYGYVRNNPANDIDPMGQCPTCVSGAVGAVGGAIIGGTLAAVSGGSWSDIGRGAARGAIIGGVSGLTLGLAGPAVAGLVGGGVTGGILAGATSAAVGNVAGQAASMALGWQCKFNWIELGLQTGGGALFGAVALRPYTAPNQTVSSWAPANVTPDLNPGRWVMTGGPTPRNWLMTGIPDEVPLGNAATGSLPSSALSYPPFQPSSWEGFFGPLKGFLGQRIIK